MIINPEISLGTVIGVVSILVTLLSLHGQNRRRFDRMEHKVDILWELFEKAIDRDAQRRDREGRR